VKGSNCEGDHNIIMMDDYQNQTAQSKGESVIECSSLIAKAAPVATKYNPQNAKKYLEEDDENILKCYLNSNKNHNNEEDVNESSKSKHDKKLTNDDVDKDDENTNIIKNKNNVDSATCINTSSPNSNRFERPKPIRQFSRRLSEGLEQVKPETPVGWTVFLSTVASLVLAHEINLQKQLTQPPLVYSQDSAYMIDLKKMLTKDNKDGLSMLTRKIQPSLFVGTRSYLASTAAYLMHFNAKKHHVKINITRPTSHFEEHIRFREIITMDTDGATIALDWELPHETYTSSLHIHKSKSQRIADIKYGPIDKPVVIILHGINNDANFGYMRSLMRSCTNHGWIACGFNFRGCGHVQATTPRLYNAGFTGDLRNVIRKVQSRLTDMDNTPVFLVGNSLGANIITKYLGEEGYSGTLPKCVKGGVSLGNPLEIHSGNLDTIVGVLLGAGIKKTIFQNWKSFYHNMSNDMHYKKAVIKTILSKTIGQVDETMSPFLIRNESKYPFSTKIGFEDGNDYWFNSSSNRYIQHVSVPLLILESQDDFLIANPALRSLSQCMTNPNVLVVKTKCGGHLGWQEAPIDGFGLGKSWADNSMADFFSSVLHTNMKMKLINTRTSSFTSSTRMCDIQTDSDGKTNDEVANSPISHTNIVHDLFASKQEQIKSKL